MSLMDDLLAKPVGTPIPAARKTTDNLTRKVEVKGDVAEVEVRGPMGEVDEDAASAYLRAQGMNPDEWVATGFRSSEWTMANGENGLSARYTFARRSGQAERPDIAELIEGINSWAGDFGWMAEARTDIEAEGHTFIVAIGDMQFGKIDGDGADGTLRRTIDCINEAAVRLADYRYRFGIDHVHIAWLGDHVEGFVSQGGANTFRTTLTMNEQIRLTRRVMMHAMLVFSPLCERLTMAAVPGNHGEPQRLSGKGVTRYDDSHDTESLIAVSEAAALAGEKYEHVEFYVPSTDEMTVVVECSGTVMAHVHGHQFRPNKHFDWWRGQAFDKKSAMHQADVLLAGHLHHEHIESDGPRTFIGVPSLESESTWYRHNTGTTGSPGIIVAVTKDGRIPLKEVVYGG